MLNKEIIFLKMSGVKVWLIHYSRHTGFHINRERLLENNLRRANIYL